MKNYQEFVLNFMTILIKTKMIGITGTDGKTSTTTIIQTLIGKDNCGYIGTNGYSYKDKKEILRIQLLIVIIYIGILMIC